VFALVWLVPVCRNTGGVRRHPGPGRVARHLDIGGIALVAMLGMGRCLQTIPMRVIMGTPNPTVIQGPLKAL
jgi:hypothetical protein